LVSAFPGSAVRLWWCVVKANRWGVRREGDVVVFWLGGRGWRATMELSAAQALDVGGALTDQALAVRRGQ
jgi:hypothetical protein